MIGFQMAGAIWSAYLKDNITVNIHVNVSSSLPSDVIGAALPGFKASQDYEPMRQALINDAKSTDDRSSASYLPQWGITAKMEGSYTTWSQDFSLAKANAKALGLMASNNTTLDGYVLLGNFAGNTSASWNYDYTRSSAANSNTLDFLTTAIHEIGHVLGFVSGLDAVDSSNFWNWNYRTNNFSALDLFRYSSKSVAYKVGMEDLTYGESSYFSVDGGKTALGYFSTGDDKTLGSDVGVKADGMQASHWKDTSDNRLGIMDPTLAKGQRGNISSLDLRALDVIGYDLVSTGINTSVNLSTLYSQARSFIAARAGQTDAWISTNMKTSPTQLTQNRDWEVVQMIKDSQVYNLGDEEGDGFWQQIQSVYWQRGLFSTLSGLEAVTGATFAGDEVLGSEPIAMARWLGSSLNHFPEGASSSLFSGAFSLAAGSPEMGWVGMQANWRPTTFDLSGLLDLAEQQSMAGVGQIAPQPRDLANLFCQFTEPACQPIAKMVSKGMAVTSHGQWDSKLIFEWSDLGKGQPEFNFVEEF
jgi:hypothetical protein